jgi:hypothetical protein
LALRGCDRRLQRPGAAPRLARDQPFGRQLFQRPADGDARHPELVHQRELARQAVDEAALVELFAQDQVDLVVLGQWQLRHWRASSICLNVLSMGHSQKRSEHTQLNAE